MGARIDTDGVLPTLTVPPQAVLTPGLAAALPVDDASWSLVWHSDHPPLIWTGASGAEPSRKRVLDEGLVLEVATAAARRRSAWVLLRASGKPGDHWLSRHLHRRVSRIVSYLFLRMRLSANTATWLTFLVGLAAGWCMAQTSHLTMLAGGLLFWAASIADGIDGEMARLTLSESAFGEQLDTAVDQLTYAAGLVGVLVGWWRQGIGVAGGTLAAVVLCGLPLALLGAMALVRRARRTTQFFVPMTPIEHAVTRAARVTRAPLLKASALVFVLFRREAFSVLFFVVSLVTDRRAAIPALLALGLGLAAGTLVIHRSAVTRSLEEIVGRPAAATATGPGAPD